MADITNLISTGTTSSNNKEEDDDKKQHEDLKEIHIRVKKRNGRKCITTMEGLNVLDQDPRLWEKLFRYFKKTLCCNGKLDKDNKSMLLSGDQREKIKKYLVEKNLCKETDIKIHGF